MSQDRARFPHALSACTAVALVGLALVACQTLAASSRAETPGVVLERLVAPGGAGQERTAPAPAEEPTEEALFEDLLANHWSRIFPDGRRNVGGPQFFKYVYEELATSHELFERYNRFYCGVSGAIVRPTTRSRYEVVQIKDAEGGCVVGKYYRCCWPCACDIMKFARVEQATLRLPKDPSGVEETYWVLTIGDPCHACDASPCDDFPPEVTVYACKDGVTANGLRVSEGRLTSGKSGRLVFAVLHDAAPLDETDARVTPGLLPRCTPRIQATPAELEEMGGMGNLFVDVARINAGETFTNSLDDLCD